MTKSDGHLLVHDRRGRDPVWHAIKVTDWLLMKGTTLCRARHMAEPRADWAIDTFSANHVLEHLMRGRRVCRQCLEATK